MNPHATNHPISWFRKFYAEGTLDLTPTFQRKPVWSDAQASYLIDSILSDLPVPEVFVRTKTSAEGETKVEVVDGQQRLRSIIRFFSGELALTGDDVSEDFIGCSWDSLDEKRREDFWSFKIVVRELEGASDVEVRDMFRRLNANQESLNDQELRHSQYSGEFTQAVEGLADDAWWIEHRVVTPRQTRRMLDVEFISEMFVGLLAGPLDKKKELDDYYIDYDEEFPDREMWEKLFLKTRELTERVTRADLTGWRSKTEYYSLFLSCGRLASESQGRVTVSDQTVERLARFRARANQAKRKDNLKKFPQYVVDYAEAVTRASTDLGRRLYRIEVVEALLRGETPKKAD